ncbi:MAG: ABC transporter permease [Ruminococcaceae bacterium]|nr:ABC transporter permease [Oscillospiraceae bacterium]
MVSHHNKPGLRGISGQAIQKLLAFATLIILIIFFSLMSPNFLIADNIGSILLATCVNGLLALGVTFVIMTGGIDLSIGTVMTFSAVVAGVCVTNLSAPLWLGVIIALMTGTIIGILTGLMVAKLRIPAFIATLGIMMMTKGLSLVISGASPVYFPNGYKEIAVGSLTQKLIPGFTLQNGVIIFFIMAIIAAVILNRTVLGRYTVAIGSNTEATRLSGVNVVGWLTAIHALCGLFCGIAGVVISSRLGSAQPALGQGYELEAIAAVVIGGTSLSGGQGTISGTVIGAFIMSILTNGLRILGVKQEWQTVVVGAVVILAVFIDIARRNNKGTR